MMIKKALLLRLYYDVKQHKKKMTSYIPHESVFCIKKKEKKADLKI